MSVLFPKVQKPREWDYRPIYHGSFREEHEKNMSEMRRRKPSRLAFWLALLVMLLFAFFYLM